MELRTRVEFGVIGAIFVVGVLLSSGDSADCTMRGYDDIDRGPMRA